MECSIRSIGMGEVAAMPLSLPDSPLSRHEGENLDYFTRQTRSHLFYTQDAKCPPAGLEAIGAEQGLGGLGVRVEAHLVTRTPTFLPSNGNRETLLPPRADSPAAP